MPHSTDCQYAKSGNNFIGINSTILWYGIWIRNVTFFSVAKWSAGQLNIWQGYIYMPKIVITIYNRCNSIAFIACFLLSHFIFTVKPKHRHDANYQRIVMNETIYFLFFARCYYNIYIYIFKIHIVIEYLKNVRVLHVPLMESHQLQKVLWLLYYL
jgi:hypothetical protein